MAEQIKDGSGKGNLAKVDGNLRLSTRSVTNNESEQATKEGLSYNINTGFITLTDDNETPILYVINNEPTQLHVTSVILGVGASTGGSGINPRFRVSKNPTSGTIVSNATSVDIVSNRNFSSNTSFQGSAYKGVTGDTLSGNGDHILGFASSTSRTVLPVDEILERGDSLGVYITPETSNTSTVVYCALVTHLEDPEDL